LVVQHLYPRNILLHSKGPKLVLLLVGLEVVDRVLQLVVVAIAPRGEGLLGDISHNITVEHSEG
jgi:hypothetical protein